MNVGSIVGLAVMSFVYVNEPVVNMREEPSLDSRVVSQALFAEKIEVKEKRDGWSHVSTGEAYSGWVPSKSFVCADKQYEGSLMVSRLAAHIYHVQDTEWGPVMTLPYGVKLKLLDDSHPRWNKVLLPDGRCEYIQKGDVASELPIQNKKDLVSLSLRFLGLPYTWGGRSSFGFDCSGFVQFLYGKLGIIIPRDNKDQILDKRFREVSSSELEPGDLVFFGKSATQIYHVGMYLGNGQFIHPIATTENQPWVRISKLSDFQWSGNKDAYYPYRTFRQLIPGIL